MSDSISITKDLYCIHRLKKVHYYNFFGPFEKTITEFRTKKPEKEVLNISKYEYAVNDLVYFKKFNASKTEKQYEGPYTVTEVGEKKKWIKVCGNKRMDSCE